jgi:pimeloyl-ACP methyl ester carboxylesterase
MFTTSLNSDRDPLYGSVIHLRRGVDLKVCHCSGKQPALVFLHGGLGNRFNWRSQYEFFLAKGREVLVYDLAGHGQSTSYSRYSIGRHQRDLTRLLDRFEIQSPILCCHSYGVPIGLEWARRHQVSGLILIAGGTHDLAPWWEIPLMKFMAWGGRHLYRFKTVHTLTERLSSDYQTEVLKRFFAENPTPVNYDAYKALEIFWKYDFFKSSRSRIKAQAPTLVVSGGRDPMFTKEMGEALNKSFALGQHLHLPQAGHLLIAEDPDIVNRAIADFIDRV